MFPQNWGEEMQRRNYKDQHEQRCGGMKINGIFSSEFMEGR